MTTTSIELDTRLVLHTRVVTGTGGGPDKTILNSPRFLADQGYPMICAYMRDPKDQQFEALVKRAQQWQAPLEPVDDFGPTDWRIVSRFVQLCQKHRPAIWHAHDYKSNLLGLLVRRQYPMKLVTTVHGWVKRTWKTPVYYAIDRMTLKHYDAVVCVSQDLHAASIRAGVPSGRCHHIPNAIDCEQFRGTCTSGEMKTRLGLPDSGFLIGSIGRLSREKGYDLLLDAVAGLIRSSKDVHLCLAGEGDQEQALRHQADNLGIADRVHMLGFTDRPGDLMQAMDAFVLSSRSEGLPNTLLEAMAMNVPVVGTSVGGVASLIVDEVNGLLIPSESVEAIQNSLLRLIEDQGLRSRLGQGGRQTIETSFSFAKRMNRIKAIYDTL